MNNFRHCCSVSRCLCEEVVNPNHRYFFRYRIGYIIIPIIYIMIVIAEYGFPLTIVFMMPKSQSHIDIILGSLALQIEIFVTMLTLGMTPLYFIDMINPEDSRMEWVAMYQKIVTIIIANIVQLIIWLCIENPVIRLFVTPLISIIVWFGFFFVIFTMAMKKYVNHPTEIV